MVDLAPAATNMLIEAVNNLEIWAVSVSAGGTDIRGKGVVEVTLEYGGSGDSEGSVDDFPLQFHVLLGHDLRIKRVYELEPDLSSLTEG